MTTFPPPSGGRSDIWRPIHTVEGGLWDGMRIATVDVAEPSIADRLFGPEPADTPPLRLELGIRPDTDPLAPARGVLVGLAVGAGLWLAAYAAIRRFLSR